MYESNVDIEVRLQKSKEKRSAIRMKTGARPLVVVPRVVTRSCYNTGTQI